MDRPSAPAAPLLAFTRFQALCRFSRARAAAAPALCSARHSAGRSLHRCPVQTGLHPVSPRTAPLSRASDAWLPASLCLKHSSSFGPSPRIRLLQPLLTSRSGSTPSPFQAQGEISPGKNAFLHRTTAGSTPPPLGHESFAVHGPLALVGTASYPVLVHRHAVYAPRFLPTLGHPHAVALHFTRCDQLVAGLPPAGMRPCRAHHRKTPNFRPGLMERTEVWPASATMRKREAIPPPQSPGAADGIAVLHKGRRAKPPETVPRRSRDPRQPYSRAPVRRSPCRSRCRDRSPRR